MTAKAVRETLQTDDTVSLKNGVFTVRRGFFYTGGFTSNKLADKVKAAFPNANILDHGEKWKPFRGGASVAQQSHWYVKFVFQGTDYRWPNDPRCAAAAVSL